MNMMSAPPPVDGAADPAATIPLGSEADTAAAARILFPHLERGQRIDAPALRHAMETAFGASDASGAWIWKTAYDACEAATVLFPRKFGKVLTPRVMLRFRDRALSCGRLTAFTQHSVSAREVS